MKDRQKKENPKVFSGIYAAIIVGIVIVVVFGIYIFGTYTNESLYQEAVTQLTEISGQLFEKLSVELDIQWGYLEKMDEAQKDTPQMTEEEIKEFLKTREQELSPTDQVLKLIAVTTEGYYYSDDGLQGVWYGATELRDIERKSFLTSDWITNENQMVFSRKLRNKLSVDGNRITYFILIRPMEEMAVYFRSSAFSSRNTTYVVDENGTKMFEDTRVDKLTLEGRNVFSAMDNQKFPHAGDFDTCLEQIEKNGITCTDVVIDDSTYYMVMKKLDGYDWSMLMLVPVDEVAASTRAMTGSMIRVFMMILIVVLILVLLSFFLVLKFRKNKELLDLKTESEEKLAITNRELEESNQKLEAAQDTIEEALAAANAASKAKSAFLANMSHDIRTPMNAIIGMTALIEHSADSPDKVKAYTDKINKSSQHLLGLINEVLDMSKIESGKLVMAVSDFSILDLIEQIEMSFRPQMEAKGQTFCTEIGNIEHEWLVGDSVRVLQILNNLLSNAMKYTPTGGKIVLHVEELEQTSAHYAQICLRVEDNGIGMSPEFIERIYDSFSREEQTTTNTVQGTGLGMSIVKSLVDLMGGSIDIDSVQGRGSTFEVILGFKISEKAVKKLPDSREGTKDSDEGLAGMRFLCAEDNELNAEILAELLHLEGAECEICRNGQDIVERFEKSQTGEYDMILMDIQMPVMNGYEAARAIRNGSHPKAKEIPILAMTANAFSEDVQNAFNAGMNAHISKPVDMKVLVKTIYNIKHGTGGQTLR